MKKNIVLIISLYLISVSSVSAQFLGPICDDIQTRINNYRSQIKQLEIAINMTRADIEQIEAVAIACPESLKGCLTDEEYEAYIEKKADLDLMEAKFNLAIKYLDYNLRKFTTLCRPPLYIHQRPGIKSVR
jgi:hypothetical protein